MHHDITLIVAYDDRFVEDLEEGIFIQQTLDTVVFDNDGKQLLVSNYLWDHVILVHAPVEWEPVPIWNNVTGNWYEHWGCGQGEDVGSISSLQVCSMGWYSDQ